MTLNIHTFYIAFRFTYKQAKCQIKREKKKKTVIYSSSIQHSSNKCVHLDLFHSPCQWISFSYELKHTQNVFTFIKTGGQEAKTKHKLYTRNASNFRFLWKNRRPGERKDKREEKKYHHQQQILIIATARRLLQCKNPKTMDYFGSLRMSIHCIVADCEYNRSTVWFRSCSVLFSFISLPFPFISRLFLFLLLLFSYIWHEKDGRGGMRQRA